MKNITAIVATHERESSLNTMIDSFHDYYPELKIVAVDSSKNPYIRKDIVHIVVPQDTGISRQRNIALKEVKTDLFLLLDDDYICTKSTDLIKLMDNILSNEYDISGGQIHNIKTHQYDFHGIYNIIGDTLYHYVGMQNLKDTNIYYDTIFNFFVAKTNKVKSMGGWDNQLRFAREHDDFFLQAKKNKLLVGYDQNVLIDHDNLIKYHSGENSQDCVRYFCNKRGISNKVEVRNIHRDNQNYISYHNCITRTKSNIDNQIRQNIIAIFGDLPIKIT